MRIFRAGTASPRQCRRGGKRLRHPGADRLNGLQAGDSPVLFPEASHADCTNRRRPAAAEAVAQVIAITTAAPAAQAPAPAAASCRGRGGSRRPASHPARPSRPHRPPGNEAGELSIARARIEGEMRSLKTFRCLDLTENVIRLRRQLREIEIQAEGQIQARVAQTHDGQTEFDPLELDRFTRFQELTRFMAESVNDVATVQQNLLKNLDDTTPLSSPRPASTAACSRN